MTAKELQDYVGKTGDWIVNAGAGVSVKVTVMDARQSYGRLDFSVKPVAGTGECWIDSEKVQNLH